MKTRNIKIGDIVLSNNVFLAPMAGITDLSFRILCKEQGAGLVYSEMVSAKGLFYSSDNTKELLDTNENQGPAAVQIFGSDPEIMGNMAKKIAREYPFEIIDINMGCPATKIVKNHEGSALMKNPDLIWKIVKNVSEKAGKPVTVKIRKGFDNEHVNAVEVAQAAEDAGAKAIAVHGRTKEEYYSGEADWDIIKKVKVHVNIPVIGNGDVKDPLSAEKMFDYTGCDAIMVARAAEGNPWIFKRINHYLETGELLPEPDMEEKIRMILRHTKMVIEHKGEFIGVREMRKHIGWYIKGLPGASELRVKINHTKTYEEVAGMFQAYL